jgi:hypothetical protein
LRKRIADAADPQASHFVYARIDGAVHQVQERTADADK